MSEISNETVTTPDTVFAAGAEETSKTHEDVSFDSNATKNEGVKEFVPSQMSIQIDKEVGNEENNSNSSKLASPRRDIALAAAKEKENQSSYSSREGYNRNRDTNASRRSTSRGAPTLKTGPTNINNGVGTSGNQRYKRSEERNVSGKDYRDGRRSELPYPKSKFQQGPTGGNFVDKKG